MKEETRDPNRATFWYDREERLAGMSDYAKRNLTGKKKGIFTRNRSLAITFFDLLALVLLFFVIRIFIQTRGAPELIDGLGISGDAYRFENRVFITLIVEKTSDKAPHGDFAVSFRALPGDVRSEASDILPEEVSETRVVRAVMADEAAEMVFATIHVGEKHPVIKLPIRGAGD